MTTHPQPEHTHEENEMRMTQAGVSTLADLDDGLTYKQRLFVEYYTGDARGNATRAASLAGYAGDYRTLSAYGCRLLQHPTVRACVRAHAAAVIGEPEVLENLAVIARRDCSDIALNARVKAIELLMRFHGMLVDKVEHSGVIESQVKMVTITVTADPQPQPQIIEGTHAHAHARDEADQHESE